jgi:hypothetical protein
MVEQGKCWLEKDLFDNIPHIEHVPSDSSGINKVVFWPDLTPYYYTTGTVRLRFDTHFASNFRRYPGHLPML